MLIDINKIQVKDRIRKDFGNLQELADDIRDNGLINPPVVTPDTYELIAGERRLRAMKLLNYKQIEVRPMAIKDAEHALNLEISENETRKDFSKAERIDYARRLERVESLKAKERMSIAGKGSQNSDTLRTDDFVAEKLGIGSRDTFRKEKFIVENQSSLSEKDFADWDEGKLSTNKAFQKIKQEKKELENRVKQLEGRQPEIKIVEKEKVIDKTDYSLADENRQLEKKCEELELLNKTLKIGQSSAKNIADSYKKDSDEYRKLKGKMLDMNMTNMCEYNVANAAIEITHLSNKISDLLINDLSPIKYKQFIETVKESEKFTHNFASILSKVKDWYEEMYRYLGIDEENNKVEIIDMEEN